jgi:hypothetical protein
MNIDFNALRPKLVQVLGEQIFQNLLLTTQLEQMEKRIKDLEKGSEKEDGK